ncbi:MAG: transposase [Anaerolineae bacterium]
MVTVTVEPTWLMAVRTRPTSDGGDNKVANLRLTTAIHPTTHLPPHKARKSHFFVGAYNKSGYQVIKVKFSRRDCARCQHLRQCTMASSCRRTLTLRTELQYRALQQARSRSGSQDFLELYRKRAGIEATVSQGVRAFGMRYTRYIGLAKTGLQQIATAAAINIMRAMAWLAGEPIASNRTTPFMQLCHSLA